MGLHDGFVGRLKEEIRAESANGYKGWSKYMTEDSKNVSSFLYLIFADTRSCIHTPET